MSQKIQIFIPTYINSATYAPARVQPRLLFYNGKLECEPYWIEGYSGATTSSVASTQLSSFPYFDNYNVVTGSFPTTGSKSLLFQNENPAYGSIPTGSLYTEYWQTYTSLLYNPKTRVLNCSAIIPLADYFKMSLNDIVNFRGNYWHLRAINDYSLKTGECNLQLLGPIIPDALDTPAAPPAPPVIASSSVSWSYTETRQDGQFKVYDNATTLTTLTANGSGNAQVIESHYVTASLVPVNYPSSGSVTMSLNVNGDTTLAVSGSTNTTISASFLVGANKNYIITSSIEWNGVNPYNYVSSARVIYDFGNPSSYSGTGTTVYDVSGNGTNATLVNSPTYSSANGGKMIFDKASSQSMTYSSYFSSAYTVQAFFKLTSGTSPAYPFIGGQVNNNGVLIGIDTGWPSNSGVYQQFYYGASGNTNSGATNDANAGTNIQNNFAFFTATNNGTNTSTYYVNTTQVSTNTSSKDRTLFTPSASTVYIIYDQYSNTYCSGELMAWLVYDRVLTGTEITQNYNIFSAR